MNRGLYTACSGMMLQLAKQDVLSNNLANLSTAGFKKDMTIAKEFPEMLLQRIGEVQNVAGVKRSIPPIEIGWIGTGGTVDRMYTDFSNGPVKQTENTMDFALKSDGYFAIQTPEGVRYTRNGSFKLNDQGGLVTDEGYAVLGEKGPIVPATPVVADDGGRINLADGTQDKMVVMRFENQDMIKKIGNSLWDPVDEKPEAVDKPGVLQGYIETSNVNAVQEMVDLISCVRAYELNQKAVQSEDQMTDRAVNEVGRKAS